MLVRTEDSLSLVASSSGDSLMLSDLRQLASALAVIPTNDSNIGPAHGLVTIDSLNFGIKAYYGDSSNWATLVQVFAYRDYIVQHYKTADGRYDSATKFFRKPGISDWTDCKLFRYWINDTLPRPPWVQDYENHGNNRYKRDTVRTLLHVIRVNDPRWDSIRSYWTYNGGGGPTIPGGETLVGSGDFVDSSYFVKTGFFTGAESTNGNQGTKLRPRRLSPGRDLYAVSFVWRRGDSQSPFGLGPAIGGALFPRSRVAAPSPMLAVARAVPYLARDNPAEDDYFFAPDWDVRLTPPDSVGVQDIYSDTAYSSHSLGSINLEDLRKYVLLP